MTARNAPGTLDGFTVSEGEVPVLSYFDPRFVHGPYAGDEDRPELPAISIPLDVLTRHELAIEDVCAVRTSEGVPAARLVTGDEVLIHTAERDLDRGSGHVFAFRGGSDTIVLRKVIVSLRGDVRLIRDLEDESPRNDTIPAAEREVLHVIGRMRWFGSNT